MIAQLTCVVLVLMQLLYNSRISWSSGHLSDACVACSGPLMAHYITITRLDAPHRQVMQGTFLLLCMTTSLSPFHYAHT